MASKRELKKAVKQMVYDVMDECDFVIVSEGKEHKKADKLMDEVADFYEVYIGKINTAKHKKDFQGLKAEIEGKAIGFVEQLNAINK